MLLPSLIFIEKEGNCFLVFSGRGSYAPAPGTVVFALSGLNLVPMKNLGFSSSKANDLCTYAPGPGEIDFVLPTPFLYSLPNPHLLLCFPIVCYVIS